MADMVELRCPCCQSTSVVSLANGMYKCQSCQNDFFYDIGENKRKKLNDIIELRQKFEFEDALDLLDTFISENKSVADGYFQKLLCSYGVTYVKDYDGLTYKPTISRASNKSILSLSEYTLLLETAQNNVIRDDYINKIAEIEKIRLEIIQKASKEGTYDIFICYKRTASDNQSYTIDSKVGRDIYDDLVKQGYKVFFAEETLTSGEEYEPVIYNALMSSTVMLVIAASKKDYLMSPWVKNEWQRFLKLVEDDETKKKTLIPVTAKGFAPEDLPIKLSKLQVLEYDGKFVNKLSNILNKKITTNLKSRLEKTIINSDVVKPIQVSEVVINKRNFSNKTQTEVILRPSDKTNLEDARNFLAKGIFDEADYYAKRVLTSNPNNPDAAWICFLVNSKVANENNIAATLPKEHKSINEMNDLFTNDLSLIVSAIDNDDNNRIHKLNVIKNIIVESAKYGNISTVLFNLYIEYIPSESELDFISELNDAYLNSYIFKNVHFDANDLKLYQEVIYNSLTKLGAEGLIQNYNNLGKLLLKIHRFADAKTYFNKSLELHSSNADALMGIFLADHNLSYPNDIAKCLNSDKNINDYIALLVQMIKGGYKVRESSYNYVYSAIIIANRIMNNNTKDLAIKLFNEVYKLMPDDVDLEDELYEFAEMLLHFKDFDDASFYFQEVISKNSYNLDAHMGLFKIKMNATSNYELLLSNEHFYKYRDNFSTLREVEANANLTAFTKFNELHEQILALSEVDKKKKIDAIKYLLKQELENKNITKLDSIKMSVINKVTPEMIKEDRKNGEFKFHTAYFGLIFRISVVLTILVSYLCFTSGNKDTNFGLFILTFGLFSLIDGSLTKNDIYKELKNPTLKGNAIGIRVSLYLFVSNIVSGILMGFLSIPVCELSDWLFTVLTIEQFLLISALFIFVPLIIKLITDTTKNLKNKKKMSTSFVVNIVLCTLLAVGGYAGVNAIGQGISFEINMGIDRETYDLLLKKTHFDFMDENNYSFRKYNGKIPERHSALSYSLFTKVDGQEKYYKFNPIMSIVDSNGKEVSLMYSVYETVYYSYKYHSINLLVALDLASEKIIDLSLNYTTSTIGNYVKETINSIDLSVTNILEDDVSNYTYGNTIQLICQHALEVYNQYHIK